MTQSRLSPNERLAQLRQRQSNLLEEAFKLLDGPLTFLLLNSSEPRLRQMITAARLRNAAVEKLPTADANYAKIYDSYNAAMGVQSLFSKSKEYYISNNVFADLVQNMQALIKDTHLVYQQCNGRIEDTQSLTAIKKLETLFAAHDKCHNATVSTAFRIIQAATLDYTTEQMIVGYLATVSLLVVPVAGYLIFSRLLNYIIGLPAINNTHSLDPRSSEAAQHRNLDVWENDLAWWEKFLENFYTFLLRYLLPAVFAVVILLLVTGQEINSVYLFTVASSFLPIILSEAKKQINANLQLAYNSYHNYQARKVHRKSQEAILIKAQVLTTILKNCSVATQMECNENDNKFALCIKQIGNEYLSREDVLTVLHGILKANKIKGVMLGADHVRCNLSGNEDFIAIGESIQSSLTSLIPVKTLRSQLENLARALTIADMRSRIDYASQPVNFKVDFSLPPGERQADLIERIKQIYPRNKVQVQSDRMYIEGSTPGDSEQALELIASAAYYRSAPKVAFAIQAPVANGQAAVSREPAPSSTPAADPRESEPKVRGRSRSDGDLTARTHAADAIMGPLPKSGVLTSPRKPAAAFIGPLPRPISAAPATVIVWQDVEYYHGAFDATVPNANFDPTKPGVITYNSDNPGVLVPITGDVYHWFLLYAIPKGSFADAAMEEKYKQAAIKYARSEEASEGIKDFKNSSQVEVKVLGYSKRGAGMKFFTPFIKNEAKHTATLVVVYKLAHHL